MLGATRGEMLEAVAQVLSQDESPDMPPKRKESDGMTLADMVAALQAIGGGTAEMWERHCCIGHCFAVWACLMAQARADGKTALNAQWERANVALAWAVQKIKERTK
jgi:hypothetical protein